MIIYIYGDDTYRSVQYLRDLTRKFSRERDPQGMNLVRLDMTRPLERDKAFAEISASPFLADKRMVVLAHLISGASKEYHEEFYAQIERGIPDTTVLIIHDSEEKPRAKVSKSLHTYLAGQPYAREFTGAKISPRTFVIEETNRLGLVLDPAALIYLSTELGSDRWEASRELERLAAYADGETLTVSDVKRFVKPQVSDNVFDLVDAIIAGRAEVAYDGIRRQYELRQDPLYIIAMLVRQFRILISLRDLFDREGVFTPAEAAKRLELHPFVVKKSVRVVQGYSLPFFEKLYAGILKLDHEIKTGQTDPSLGLDLFLAKVCLMQKSRTKKQP